MTLRLARRAENAVSLSEFVANGAKCGKRIQLPAPAFGGVRPGPGPTLWEDP